LADIGDDTVLCAAQTLIKHRENIMPSLPQELGNING
jgi:hypothetical protein